VNRDISSKGPLHTADELPVGLTWSNTLVTLSPKPLMEVARDQFDQLIASREDDDALRERIREYVQEAHDRLGDLPGSETILLALGTPDEICGPPRTARSSDADVTPKAVLGLRGWWNDQLCNARRGVGRAIALGASGLSRATSHSG
jgi:hypothetical protein